jgi:putative transposase
MRCVRQRLVRSDGRVPQSCISEATFYIWKKKYADLGASEVRRLRQLEEENSRLKRVVADLTLDKNILQEVIRKKV